MGNSIARTFNSLTSQINNYYYENIDRETFANRSLGQKIICDLFHDFDLDWIIPNDEFYKLESMRKIDKQLVYNEENVGILEIKLPDEIIVHILSFLPFESIVKLGRVSRNFRKYWIELPQLWQLRSAFDILSLSECIMPYCPVFSKTNPLMNQLFFQKSVKTKISNAFIPQPIEDNDMIRIPIIVLFVGSDKCGKSQLISKAMRRENFTDFYIPTIGLDTYSCRYRYHNRLYHFNTWDTSGNVRFSFVNSTLHSKAKVNCFCFSLNDYSSFTRLKEIFNDWKTRHAENNVMEYLEQHNSCAIILGLKSDLEEMVPPNEIRDFILNIGPPNGRLYTNRIQYFRLSSKNHSFEDLMFPFLYARSIIEQPIMLNYDLKKYNS